MNIISQVLSDKTRSNSRALVPFLTAGYPNIQTTIKALHILDREGADIIELGIPYADALADGPVIQHSSQIALQNGVHMNEILYMLSVVKSSINTPLIIFTYYNPMLVYGINNFIASISELNVRGLIVPDLPLEEVDYLLDVCNNLNVELILFVAPTSSYARITTILSKSSGCIYLVSSTGVTGTRQYINNHINQLANYIKSKTDKNIMLGFGISSPQQVKEICRWNIDGIVIGSAVINIISKDVSLQLLSKFCKSIKSSMT